MVEITPNRRAFAPIGERDGGQGHTVKLCVQGLYRGGNHTEPHKSPHGTTPALRTVQSLGAYANALPPFLHRAPHAKRFSPTLFFVRQSRNTKKR